MAQYSGHEYVKIGGLNWATMNIGATAVTDVGLYFQWGDTKGYGSEDIPYEKRFEWEDYKYNEAGDGETFDKYNSSDNKKILDDTDDAAKVIWGGKWRMPTIDELRDFFVSVNSTWVDDYKGSGVEGLVCKDLGDESIELFFPNGGYADNGEIDFMSIYLWSSSLDESSYDSSYSLLGVHEAIGSDLSYRYQGIPIRPVFDACCSGDYCDELANSVYLEEMKEAIKQEASVIPSDVEFVDLGLPSGTMWAKTNVGASVETEYGNYYQYGKGSRTYNLTSAETIYDKSENPLASSADTATQVLGIGCCMPTDEQYTELKDNTAKQRVTIGGVNGIKYMNRYDNTKYIFIPFGGYYSNGSLDGQGYSTALWTSTPEIGTSQAFIFRIGSREEVVMYEYRECGMSIRAVLNNNVNVCIDIPNKAAHVGCCNADANTLALLSDDLSSSIAVIAENPVNDVSGYIIDTVSPYNGVCGNNKKPFLRRKDITMFFSNANSNNIAIASAPTYCDLSYEVTASKGYKRYRAVCDGELQKIMVLSSEEIYEYTAIEGNMPCSSSITVDTNGFTFNATYGSVTITSETIDNCGNSVAGELTIAPLSSLEIYAYFAHQYDEEDCEGGKVYFYISDRDVLTYSIGLTISAKIDGEDTDIYRFDEYNYVELKKNEEGKESNNIQITFSACESRLFNQTIEYDIPRTKCEITPSIDDLCDVFWDVDETWKDGEDIEEYYYNGTKIR